jgi:hypothetical protein
MQGGPFVGGGLMHPGAEHMYAQHAAAAHAAGMHGYYPHGHSVGRPAMNKPTGYGLSPYSQPQGPGPESNMWGHAVLRPPPTAIVGDRGQAPGGLNSLVRLLL